MVKSPLSGELLDEQAEFTLEELCSACSMESHWIVELVDEGALEPSIKQAGEWRFTAVNLHRAQIAVRLRRDLGVNTAGIALALDLLDELQLLRSRQVR